MSDHRSKTAQGAKARQGEAPSGTPGQRLWRLRKLHQFVDAELWAVTDTNDVELRYSYNGERAYRRRRPNRALAIKEATEKRAELERDGWVFHW